MKFKKEENCETVTAAVVEYCNISLIPIISRGAYNITCLQSKSMAFNARVETVDGKNFLIVINNGIAASLIDVINRFDNKIIDEEIEILSNQILTNKSWKDDIYKCIAYSATFFVVLHELSHIQRRHLHHMLNSKIAGECLCFQEIDGNSIENSLVYSEAFFIDNFQKLIELDADAYSIILLLSLSVELFGATSEFYEVAFPNWRNEPENHQHRILINQIMLYSSCLAFGAIEAKRGTSKSYPSPFTRILNAYDAFNQEIYKMKYIMSSDPSQTNIVYLKADDELKNVMVTIVFPTFLNSIDIIIETCRLMNHDLSEKYSISEDTIAKNLLSDFTQLLMQLSPNVLRTKEGEEFKMLRLYRPKFNEIFTHFLNFSENDE